MLRLEDLKFREETRDGGTVIEYLVEGRKKTQAVPRMVGEVLEAVVKGHLDLLEDHRAIVHQYGDFIIELRAKERERERLASTSGRNGDGERSTPGSGEPGPAKEKEATGPKKRASKTA